MKRFKSIFILLLTILSLSSQAQNERKFVRQGNKIYEQAAADTTKADTTAFSQAEVAYRKALENVPTT